MLSIVDLIAVGFSQFYECWLSLLGSIPCPWEDSGPNLILYGSSDTKNQLDYLGI